MSSIRPLVTLTIIVVVGVVLFRKINEGPAHIPHGGAETLSTSDIPPLAVAPPVDTTATGVPEINSETTASTTPAAPQWAEPVSETDGVPPIPALPPIASATQVEPNSPATSVAPPIPAVPTASLDPPASIPTAQYSTDSAADEPMTPVPTATPFGATAATPTTEPPTPAVEAVAPVGPVDRYATTTTETTPVATAPIAQAPPADAAPIAESPSAPQPSSLAMTWPEIQSALERQELAQAHQKLSQFYGNPTLSPSEAQQVETLLSQLAGTVVYSTDHRLEPPYVAQPGDTLETIAAKYEVPWQLLAKINGIPTADMLQPGQELKVVHGPFSAVVEMSKGQLTLMLGDRYAGRFPILAEPAAPVTEGQWTLEQKLVNPPTKPDSVVSASYTAAPPSVDRVLVLRNDSSQNGATISIASSTATPTGPTAVAPAAFRVSPQDAEELSDILSVGSRVTIRK